MNTLIYVTVAVLAGALSLRAWLQERGDPTRLAFAALGLNLACSYTAFALYLATAFWPFALAWSAGAALLPLSLWVFLARLLQQPRDTWVRPATWLAWLSPLVGLAYLLAELLVFKDPGRASPAGVALALFVLGGVGLSLVQLAMRYGDTQQRVERTRLRYLLALLGGALFFSGLEALARALADYPELAGLNIFTSPVVLQGAVPPVGALISGLLFYVLHQVLVLYRLLDLHEIFSRLLTLGICGAVLVLAQGIAVLWTDAMSLSPVHGTYLALVATVLFLAVYDPLRRMVEARTSEWLNRRGRVLNLTLREVDQGLAKAISLDRACSAMLDPLQASGRVPYAAIYLWDEEQQQFPLAAASGSPEAHPMDALAQVAPEEQALAPWYVRSDLQRAGRSMESAEHQARLLGALACDVLLPIASGSLVLGWLALKDEPWSDGFSQDELSRLRRSVDRLALALDNIHGFERLKEQHRLAALGTMAAGLAHEIRNPLAGIKGAAQYLAADEPAEAEEAGEFVQIIIDEVDRLNEVVSQFLDYARPFEIERRPVDLNALVKDVLELVRRQDLPQDLRIVEALEPDLPQPPADAARLRQVMLNLVQNALQALANQPDGADRLLTVSTRLTQGGRGELQRSADVAVEDSGPGIEPPELDQLFIPFFTTRPGGTGLGLSICRRIVQAHDGEIDVRSQPGRGARFTVRLPLPGELERVEG